MSDSASLACLKVAEFFKLCNWQLLPQAKPNLQRPSPPETTVLQQANPPAASCLSVKEFFNLCNWQLLPQALPSLSHLDQIQSNSPQQTASLSCLSVKEFFNLCNWQLVPLENTYLPPQVEQAVSLNTLPVQQFFQFIPWDGSPEIGSLPQQTVMLPIAQEKAPTLNDLSNLF